MNETPKKSFDWIKQIPSSLLQWDDIPLLGSAPNFPWQEFSSQISQSLGLGQLTLEPSDIQWVTESEYAKGVANPVALHFSIDAIEGTVSFMMPKDDIAYLVARLLSQNSASNPAINQDLFDGFYHFLALEAIRALGEVEFDKTLSLHVIEEGNLPHEAALCQDIAIKLPEKNIVGRLLISSDFRKSWAQHYSPKTFDALLASPLSEKLDLTVHLRAGQTTLPQQMWQQINPGDCLLLDDCWVDPDSNEGELMLVINDVSLYNGKFSQGKITVGEPAQMQQVSRYSEVEKVMNTPPPKNPSPKNEDEDFGDEDFDFDEDDFDIDEDFDDDEDFDEEFTDEIEEDQSEEPEEQPEKPAKEHAPEKKDEPAPAAAAVEQAAELFSPEELPLAVSVEVGRFQMSIKKLLELEPGNLLELGVRPENGVDLVVNGKCIAKGELMRIGDTLGVRIIEK